MRCRSPFASGLTFLLLAAALPPASAAPASRDPVDWVNPFIGTATARWFFFSSACRPFGMVNLSPDTRTDGDWMNGYLHGDSVIRCLSHVHCWQLSGIPVMPTTGPMQGHLGMDAYQSPFSHDDEEATPGYHRVVLQRYGITAEMTSTPRVGLHRFTFPADTNSAVLFDLGATLGPSAVSRAHARRTGERALEGWSVLAPTSRRPKPVTVYFVAEFDRPMTRFGVWKDRTLIPADSVEGPGSGAWAGFITAAGDRVHMKVALSYTSLDNARRNLAAELPGWDFDGVRRASRDEWNAWLSRLDIEGGTPAQRTRFYTDLWHALLGRRTVSDVGGSYYDATGDTPRVRTVTPGPRGETFPHYNFDAHWGAQWTLSPLWSLAYPEVLDGFCATMVDMYRNGGLIPRGPAGGNYTFVMTGDSSVPLFAAALAKGIRGYDVRTAYEGVRKNAFPGGIRDRAGYEFGPAPTGGGMTYYVERGYVPHGLPGKAMHRAGASMTLEYAYQDWCLAQMAAALGHTNDARLFATRAGNYANLWDAGTGYMRPRTRDGGWLEPFSPTGRGAATPGFAEGNAAIYSYWVPHDVPGLIRLMGGNAAFTRRLNAAFETSEPAGFVVGHGKHAEGWTDYDNQPGTHMAHLFNHSGAPWLSQKWTRRVKELAFGGITPESGYHGDEDQGQMGALGVLLALGLFTTDGGAAQRPTWEITSPIFDRITVHLNPRYYPGRTFIITTKHNAPDHPYIQSATLNGQPLTRFWFTHADLVKGGTLELTLGPKPNPAWGVGPSPVPRVPRLP